jgi:quinol monooxygenase YgiN
MERSSILRLSETWRDRASLAAHFETAHMAAFREALRAEGQIRSEIEILVVRGREQLDLGGDA